MGADIQRRRAREQVILGIPLHTLDGGGERIVERDEQRLRLRRTDRHTPRGGRERRGREALRERDQQGRDLQVQSPPARATDSGGEALPDGDKQGVAYRSQRPPAGPTTTAWWAGSGSSPQAASG